MNRRTFLGAVGAAVLVAVVPFQAPIPSSRPNRLGVLTPREREIALLMAQGLTHQEIAVALWMSRRTVDVRVQHVVSKLDVPTRAAAIAIIRAEGRGSA